LIEAIKSNPLVFSTDYTPINLGNIVLERLNHLVQKIDSAGQTEIESGDPLHQRVEFNVPERQYTIKDGGKIVSASIQIQRALSYNFNGGGQPNTAGQVFIVRNTVFRDKDNNFVKSRNDVFYEVPDNPEKTLYALAVDEGAYRLNDFETTLSSAYDKVEELYTINEIDEQFTEGNKITWKYYKWNKVMKLYKVVEEEPTSDGLTKQTMKNANLDIKGVKLYSTDRKRIIRALYPTKEGNASYNVVYDNGTDQFYLANGSFDLNKIDIRSITLGNPIDFSKPEAFLDSTDQLPPNLKGIWNERRHIVNAVTGGLYGGVFYELLNGLYANGEAYTAGNFKVVPFEDEDKKTVSGLVVDNDEYKGFTVGYFSYNKENGALDIWEPNGKYKHRLSIIKNQNGTVRVFGLIAQYRLKYGDGSVHLISPDQDKINKVYEAFQKNERQEASRQYVFSQLTRQGIFAWIVKHFWQEPMSGNFPLLPYLPSITDTPLTYERSDGVTIAMDGELKGEGAYDIYLVPTQIKTTGETRKITETEKMKELEKFLADSQIGDVVRLKHSFDVTKDLAFTAAATAVSLGTDLYALPITRGAIAAIEAGTPRISLIGDLVSGFGKILQSIPKFGPVLKALNSLKNDKIVFPLMRNMTEGGLFAQMGIRAIEPFLQPSLFATNAARLVAWGVPLQLFGMWGQLPQMLKNMTVEQIVQQVASGASMSFPYSTLFGITLPLIGRGLEKIGWGAVYRYLQMFTPQYNPELMGPVTANWRNYGIFGAGFFINEWLLEEVIFPQGIDKSLDIVQWIAGKLKTTDLFWAKVYNDLEIWRDVFNETLSEAMGGG